MTSTQPEAFKEPTTDVTREATLDTNHRQASQALSSYHLYLPKGHLNNLLQNTPMDA